VDDMPLGRVADGGDGGLQPTFEAHQEFVALFQRGGADQQLA
jgi:hypothetical protein